MGSIADLLTGRNELSRAVARGEITQAHRYPLQSSGVGMFLIKKIRDLYRSRCRYGEWERSVTQGDNPLSPILKWLRPNTTTCAFGHTPSQQQHATPRRVFCRATGSTGTIVPTSTRGAMLSSTGQILTEHLEKHQLSALGKLDIKDRAQRWPASNVPLTRTLSDTSES